MASINYQDPQGQSATSPLIAGFSDIMKKVTQVLDMEIQTLVDIPLNYVPYYNDNTEIRILFQASQGDKGWLPSPVPIIKRNGIAIENGGYTIDYIGGSIMFDMGNSQAPTDIFTASVTNIKPSSAIINSQDDRLSTLEEATSAYKGYYETLEALKLAIPRGKTGDFAIIGGLVDTIAIWDKESNDWKNITTEIDLSSYVTKAALANEIININNNISLKVSQVDYDEKMTTLDTEISDIKTSVTSKANLDLTNIENATFKAKAIESGISIDSGLDSIQDGNTDGSLRGKNTAVLAVDGDLNNGIYMGTNSIQFGSNTAATRDNTITSGMNNQVNSENSAVFGRDNISEGGNVYIEGDSNIFLGNDLSTANIYGTGNSINASATVTLSTDKLYVILDADFVKNTGFVISNVKVNDSILLIGSTIGNPNGYTTINETVVEVNTNENKIKLSSPQTNINTVIYAVFPSLYTNTNYEYSFIIGSNNRQNSKSAYISGKSNVIDIKSGSNNIINGVDNHIYSNGKTICSENAIIGYTNNLIETFRCYVIGRKNYGHNINDVFYIGNKNHAQFSDYILMFGEANTSNRMGGLMIGNCNVENHKHGSWVIDRVDIASKKIFVNPEFTPLNKLSSITIGDNIILTSNGDSTKGTVVSVDIENNSITIEASLYSSYSYLYITDIDLDDNPSVTTTYYKNIIGENNFVESNGTIIGLGNKTIKYVDNDGSINVIGNSNVSADYGVIVGNVNDVRGANGFCSTIGNNNLSLSKGYSNIFGMGNTLFAEAGVVYPIVNFDSSTKVFTLYSNSSALNSYFAVGATIYTNNWYYANAPIVELKISRIISTSSPMSFEVENVPTTNFLPKFVFYKAYSGNSYSLAAGTKNCCGAYSCSIGYHNISTSLGQSLLFGHYLTNYEASNSSNIGFQNNIIGNNSTTIGYKNTLAADNTYSFGVNNYHLKNNVLYIKKITYDSTLRNSKFEFYQGNEFNNVFPFIKLYDKCYLNASRTAPDSVTITTIDSEEKTISVSGNFSNIIFPAALFFPNLSNSSKTNSIFNLGNANATNATFAIVLGSFNLQLNNDVASEYNVIIGNKNYTSSKGYTNIIGSGNTHKGNYGANIIGKCNVLNDAYSLLKVKSFNKTTRSIIFENVPEYKTSLGMLAVDDTIVIYNSYYLNFNQKKFTIESIDLDNYTIIVKETIDSTMTPFVVSSEKINFEFSADGIDSPIVLGDFNCVSSGLSRIFGKSNSDLSGTNNYLFGLSNVFIDCNYSTTFGIGNKLTNTKNALIFGENNKSESTSILYYLMTFGYNNTNLSQYSMLVGVANSGYLAGTYNYVFGSSNKAGVTKAVNYNLISGTNCNVDSNYNYVGGSGSSVAIGDYNLVHGSGCSSNRSFNFVMGSNCKAETDSFNIISGNICTVTGSHNSVVGDNCKIISGAYNDVHGINCTNTGSFSFVHGNTCTSTSDYNFILGSGCSASGTYNHVSGKSCSAEGNHNFVHGNTCESSGDTNIVLGFGTKVSGFRNLCIGHSTNITSNATSNISCGYQHSMTGFYSIAVGEVTSNVANASSIMGYHLDANSKGYKHIIGKYNVLPTIDTVSVNTLGDAFTIGNGTASGRSNCFRVQYDGKVYAKGAYSASGADYAELIEWLDGNENNEDRRGHFVTLVGNYVRYANSPLEVFGCVSSNPSVLANNHSETWKDMYLRDMWGDVITELKSFPDEYMEEEHEIETVNDDGETVYETQKIKKLLNAAYTSEVPVLNPDYKQDKPYIARESRKEWCKVGREGQIIMVDDGSCVVGKLCNCTAGGIATKSDKGYMVMERLDANHIKIYFGWNRIQTELDSNNNI